MTIDAPQPAARAPTASSMYWQRLAPQQELTMTKGLSTQPGALMERSPARSFGQPFPKRKAGCRIEATRWFRRETRSPLHQTARQTPARVVPRALEPRHWGTGTTATSARRSSTSLTCAMSTLLMACATIEAETIETAESAKRGTYPLRTRSYPL